MCDEDFANYRLVDDHMTKDSPIESIKSMKSHLSKKSIGL